MTRHLETLERAGLIKTSERGAEGGYVFNPRQVESLAGQLAGLRETVDLSESQLGEADRKILAHFLEADGSLRQIPLQPKKLLPILRHALHAFESGRKYSDKEVNAILARLHPDTAALRRHLVDYRMLARERDGSAYWLA